MGAAVSSTNVAPGRGNLNDSRVTASSHDGKTSNRAGRFAISPPS
jgi:hypothetical protein